MKKTQLGSRDLLANGGGCPVEVHHLESKLQIDLLYSQVFCRLRPPKDNNNDQQSDNSSSCIKVSSSTELTLYSSEVCSVKFSFNHLNIFIQNAKNGQIREVNKSMKLTILLNFSIQSRYEFSHILTDNVSQSAAFKELALPLLDELIQGKSSMFAFC